ncbi:hypothetical protein F66182_10862 [Fusarium sp. NRRL 66182]|nr:hypothetical protein F66182_10862 [Fusarium sp. NRRL 66182]
MYDRHAIGVIGAEIWCIRVCLVHHRILQHRPYDVPEPIHSILHLDPEKPPFSYTALGSSNTAVVDSIRAVVADGFSARFADRLQDAVRSGEDMDEETSIAMTVLSLLSDDETRVHYARRFLPALKPTTAERFMSQESIRQARVKQLEKLCA